MSMYPSRPNSRRQRPFGCRPYPHRFSGGMQHRGFSTIASDYGYGNLAQNQGMHATEEPRVGQLGFEPHAQYGQSIPLRAGANNMTADSGVQRGLPGSARGVHRRAASDSAILTENQQEAYNRARRAQFNRAHAKQARHHYDVHRLGERQLGESHNNGHDTKSRPALAQQYCMINEHDVSGQRYGLLSPGCDCLQDDYLCQALQRPIPNHMSDDLLGLYPPAEPSFLPFDGSGFEMGAQSDGPSMPPARREDIGSRAWCAKERALNTGQGAGYSKFRTEQWPSNTQLGYQGRDPVDSQNLVMTAWDPYRAATLPRTQMHNVLPATTSTEPAGYAHRPVSQQLWRDHCTSIKGASTHNDRQSNSLIDQGDAAVQTQCSAVWPGEVAVSNATSSCGTAAYECSRQSSCKKEAHAYDDFLTEHNAAYSSQEITDRAPSKLYDYDHDQVKYHQATPDLRGGHWATTTADDADGDLDSEGDTSDAETELDVSSGPYFRGVAEAHSTRQTALGGTTA